jgi:hypothetical protein
MPYWCCARFELRRETVAAHFLTTAGYEIYLPRLRGRAIYRGRHVERRPLLFPSYGFVHVVNGWWHARWACGVASLIMNGATPAVVGDDIIAGIRARERDGLVELPRRPLMRGQQIRVLRGAFVERVGLFEGINGHGRVHILLALLGTKRRVTLPRDDIAAL